VPWDVAQSVRHRVAALAPPSGTVLGAAAVAGRAVAPAVLRAVVGEVNEEGLLAALDAACAARLLGEGGVGGYQFAHDVIREVVETDLGAARRAVLHRRVAQALEAQPGAAPPERVAYHYARSDARDKAALYLERAGDQAREQYANSAAEAFYRDAAD